jgi:hypothetical protein
MKALMQFQHFSGATETQSVSLSKTGDFGYAGRFTKKRIDTYNVNP